MQNDIFRLPTWAESDHSGRMAYISIAVTTASDIAHLLAFCRMVEMPKEETRQTFGTWSKMNHSQPMSRQEISRLYHGFYIERRDRKKSRRQQRLSKGARERRNIKAWHKATGE